MMKLRSVGMALAVAATLAAAPALAGEAYLWVHNDTGDSIVEIYVSPAGQGQWGSGMLRAGTVEADASTFLKFGAGAPCERDVKAILGDGQEATWKAIDVCAIDRLTLLYDRTTREEVALVE